MLAVSLAQVKLRGVEEITDELEFLLESGEGVHQASSQSNAHTNVLTPEQASRMQLFAKHSIFKPVEGHIVDNEETWANFLSSPNPENSVPMPWEPATRT